MIAFCREVDKRTGEIAVYTLKWEGFSDVIIRNFKRKEVTRITIEGIGGIVEL